MAASAESEARHRLSTSNKKSKTCTARAEHRNIEEQGKGLNCVPGDHTRQNIGRDDHLWSGELQRIAVRQT